MKARSILPAVQQLLALLLCLPGESLAGGVYPHPVLTGGGGGVVPPELGLDGGIPHQAGWEYPPCQAGWGTPSSVGLHGGTSDQAGWGYPHQTSGDSPQWDWMGYLLSGLGGMGEHPPPHQTGWGTPPVELDGETENITLSHPSEDWGGKNISFLVLRT